MIAIPWMVPASSRWSLLRTSEDPLGPPPGSVSSVEIASVSLRMCGGPQPPPPDDVNPPRLWRLRFGRCLITDLVVTRGPLCWKSAIPKDDWRFVKTAAVAENELARNSQISLIMSIAVLAHGEQRLARITSEPPPNTSRSTVM
jgi:hypothetical protein